VQPALGDPAWAGGLGWVTPEVPANPCHAGSLGFSDMGAHPRCHPPTLLPPRRVVVRRLRPLQPQRHLLPGAAQHPQAQRHPLAPLPGPQLLPEGHPHADTTRQLLARRCPPGTEGGGRERGWLRETEPSPPPHRRFSPIYYFLLYFFILFSEMLRIAGRGWASSSPRHLLHPGVGVRDPPGPPCAQLQGTARALRLLDI